MRLLIENIGQIVQVVGDGSAYLTARKEHENHLLANVEFVFKHQK